MPGITKAKKWIIGSSERFSQCWSPLMWVQYCSSCHQGKLHLLQFCFTSPPCLPHNVHYWKIRAGNTVHSLKNSSEVALSGGFSKISRSGLAFHFGPCLSWFVRGKGDQPAAILQKGLLSCDDGEKCAKPTAEGLVMFSFCKSSITAGLTHTCPDQSSLYLSTLSLLVQPAVPQQKWKIWRHFLRHTVPNSCCLWLREQKLSLFMSSMSSSCMKWWKLVYWCSPLFSLVSQTEVQNTEFKTEWGALRCGLKWQQECWEKGEKERKPK